MQGSKKTLPFLYILKNTKNLVYLSNYLYRIFLNCIHLGNILTK